MIGRWLHAFLGGMLVLLGSSHAVAALPETIERIKPSVVVVGTFNKLRSPQFVMRGTGFVVGDGSLIATNAHVIPRYEGGDTQEILMVLTRNGTEVRPREVRLLVSDAEHDLAVLRMTGTPLPALVLRPADSIREGQADRKSVV